jgi:two-component system cell cycle sensor histidine kinase/response regulator CckA
MRSIDFGGRSEAGEVPPSRSKGTREEEATEALIGVIRLAAPGPNSHDLIRSILEHVRSWLGCQAAGIRLKEGGDYPYFEVQGFPAEFVSLENSLCATGPDGAPLHDLEGSPVLECMCSNVLLGRVDPEKPFFTAGGSFWTNSTTRLLATATEADQMARNRNRCNGEGYESVALVPLQAGGEIIGLLQLNDKRRNRFTLNTIARVEKVAAGIALILAERQAQEALRVGEERHRALFEQSLDGIVLATTEGTILEANPAACAMFGMTEDELRRSRREDLVVMDRVTVKGREERDQTGRAAGEVTFIRKDGTLFPVGFTASFLVGADGSRRSLLSFRDITERRSAEEALRQSERDLLEAQELAHIGNFTLDLVTQQLTWSEEMFRIWGLDPEQSAPRADVSDWMYPGDYERVARAAVEAMEHGTPYDMELRIRRPDGAERTIVITAKTESDATGKVVVLKGTHQDITERRRVEENFRTLFREMLDGFALHELICDEQGNPIDYRYLLVNPAFERLFGARAEEIVGRTGLETQPDLDPEWIKVCGEVALNGTPHVIEDYRQSGESHLHVALFQPAPGQFAAIFADITERKQAEEALRENEAKIRGILDSIRVGVALISPELEVLELNPLMREWFPAVDAGQRPLCYRVFNVPPRERPCDDCPTIQTLQDGLTHERTVSREVPAGVRDRRVISSPIRDETGKITGAVEMIEDITDRLALEIQLQQAQKMESVGRLAGGVAHDFNNMLGVILGHTEMALEQTDPTNPLWDDLTEIRKAAERSADLTRQLLAFARKQTVAPRVLDLNESVAGMLSMLERLIGEDIRLDWQPAADLWAVKVDPSQVGQILTNLCVNARDAIPGVGRVTIATLNRALDPAYCAAHAGAAPGEYVQLAVNDDGCGVEKETLGRLFEPFFTTKAVGEGTGLGLATVYGIVRQNNGFVTVDSEPGEGSTFTVYLPRHVAAAEPLEQRGNSAPAARGRETILLVEDEPAILRLAARMLESHGYTVVAASGPGEAIRLAREHRGELHLLITDVVMPEMNGRDLAKNLLSLYPRIRRLFMSGYTSDVIAHQGVLEEGVHFIQKPFITQELAAEVRRALDNDANCSTGAHPR